MFNQQYYTFFRILLDLLCISRSLIGLTLAAATLWNPVEDTDYQGLKDGVEESRL